ncbi:MAG: hypothetical protein UY91_C0019G0001, partial [Parcubacteria group bacterium GW2011_GWB1_55_9]
MFTRFNLVENYCYNKSYYVTYLFIYS